MGDKRLPWNQRLPKKNPCSSAPQYPANVAMTFQATEALTHLRFTGKVKWDAVTEDQDTFPVKIDRYEVQYMAVDVNDDPVETEDSKTRFRIRHKAPVSHVGITDATTSGTVATFTTARQHGFQADDVIVVTGVSPSAYNGTWDVISAPTNTTLTADIGASPGNLTSKGKMEDGTDTHHIVTGNLPRPKRWYWKARVRARNTENCWSPWSPWTTPTLPWTGADPTPPEVVGVSIDWEHPGQKRFGRWVGIVRWTEVEDFDYPGTPADDEDDVARYAIQIQRSTDGVNPVGTTRRHLIEAKDADADTEAHYKFRRVNERHYYRARVRCIDRFNRRGPWSDPWTDWELPGQDLPPAPDNVRIKGKQKDSVVVVFDAPIEAGEVDVIDEEIEHFQVQIATGTFTGGTTWDPVYEFDRRVTGEKKVFGIEDTDRDLVFFGRARSATADGIKSAWIPAVTGSGGNSLSGTAPDGVRLVRDRVVAEWTVNNPSVKTYHQMWTADRRYKFVKVRARCGLHTQADHPSADGCPTGSALILQVKHHTGGEDGSDDTITNLFTSDSRIQIPASKHKDTVWADDMTLTHIEEDERLAIRVSQVGSTNAGEDLVVQVVMVPD